MENRTADFDAALRELLPLVGCLIYIAVVVLNDGHSGSHNASYTPSLGQNMQHIRKASPEGEIPCIRAFIGHATGNIVSTTYCVHVWCKVLARDTRGELMPYFVDTIFGTLVWLLETRLEDPDAMEWIFQCMGYLFK